VPGHDPVERAGQHLGVQLAGEPEHQRHLVLRPGRVDLVGEPQPLLRGRERDRRVAGDAGHGVAAFRPTVPGQAAQQLFPEVLRQRGHPVGELTHVVPPITVRSRTSTSRRTTMSTSTVRRACGLVIQMLPPDEWYLHVFATWVKLASDRPNPRRCSHDPISRTQS
jgi:hypothetical protein